MDVLNAKWVGRWRIAGTFYVSVQRRPRWITRIAAKFLLEFEYEDFA